MKCLIMIFALVFSTLVHAEERLLAPGQSGIVCGDTDYDERAAAESLNWYISTGMTEYSELYVKISRANSPMNSFKVVAPFDVSAPTFARISERQVIACATVTKR